jgi:MFS family permease
MGNGHKPYHALRHPDFRRLWLSQLVSLLGSQMQSVAMHWHVYLLTGSPLALGLMGLVRVLPIILFSLWGGVVADRRDRRWVMFGAQTVMAAASAALAAITFGGYEGVVSIYALSAVLAAASSFDNPARQALVPRLVPIQDLPGALSLNLTAFHVALICGPALAGLLIAGSAAAPSLPQTAATSASTSVLAWIYALNTLSFAFVLVTLATMKTSGKVAAQGTPEPTLEAFKAGLRFVFRTPIMVWTTGLDFFATFFAGSLSLLPIFADQILRVGPAGYGWLVAAPALGAVLGSAYTSIRPLPRRQGLVFLWAVVAYGVATAIYGLSRSYLLTFLALAASGLADLVSTVIRQTLRQFITPDALRGRMTAVNMVFFMGGPQLGELEAGLVASLFDSVALGVTVSVVSGGILTVLVAAAVAAATPLVRSYEHDAAAPGSPG